MIHQPSGGAGGQTSDISIAAKEILRWRRTINEVLAEKSGKTVEELENDSDRDYYMTAEEAKEYGLVDNVISKSPRTDFLRSKPVGYLHRQFEHQNPNHYGQVDQTYLLFFLWEISERGSEDYRRSSWCSYL